MRTDQCRPYRRAANILLSEAFGRQILMIREPRHALSRAISFLEKAKACPVGERDDFELFLEASMVFARAAIHRLKSKHLRHPNWLPIWDSWTQQPAVEFFRKERNWILKEGPPKIGQKVFAPFIGRTSDESETAFVPATAAELYYFEEPDTPATVTVERYLASLSTLISDAEVVLQ